jgi:hypothetical protein
MAETFKSVKKGTWTKEMYNTRKFYHLKMTLSSNATEQGSRNLQLTLNLATSPTLRNKMKESKVPLSPKKKLLIFLSKRNPNTKKKTFNKNCDVST